jgi:hypothetical protein
MIHILYFLMSSVKKKLIFHYILYLKIDEYHRVCYWKPKDL